MLVVGRTIEAHTPDGTRELDVGRGRPAGRAEAYRNLIAAIEQGTPVYANEVNGLRMNEVLNAMERSRASGRRKPVIVNEDA